MKSSISGVWLEINLASADFITVFYILFCYLVIQLHSSIRKYNVTFSYQINMQI